MKKQLIIVAICIGLLPLVLKAQTTTTNGPKLDLNEKSIVWVLEDNSDYLRMATVEISPRGSYDNIYVNTYNKQNNTLVVQEIDEDFEGRFVFLTGDGMLNVIQEYMNKKTKMLEYRKASFPMDSKVPKKLEFLPFYSIPLDGMKDVFVKAAYSEDMSKFAIYTVLKTGDWRNPKHHVDVAVFDAEGTLLWHQSQQANDWFHAENILLSNDGTVYMADYGNVRNPYGDVADYLIVSVYTEQGVESQKIAPECVNFSCRKLLMPNGDMKVVGIGEKKGGEYAVLTYSVSPDGNVDFSEAEISLSTKMNGITYENKYANQKQKYEPYVFNVIRLSNGKLFLTGEMGRVVEVGTYQDSNIPLYGRQTQNMFYAILTENGELLDSNEYPRSTVTKAELGDGNATRVNPVDAFEYNGNVYLLCNDHRNNYKGNHQSWNTLYNNIPNQCCVVLSEVENNGELQSSILYMATTKFKDPRYIAQQYDHEYYLRIVKVTDDGVYYILKNDGEYRLEKITF